MQDTKASATPFADTKQRIINMDRLDEYGATCRRIISMEKTAHERMDKIVELLGNFANKIVDRIDKLEKTVENLKNDVTSHHSKE